MNYFQHQTLVNNITVNVDINLGLNRLYLNDLTSLISKQSARPNTPLYNWQEQ